jgi:hypothetical protein
MLSPRQEGDHNVQANPRTIKHVFEGEHRYVVPLFQRSYRWNESEQWEPLWEDLRRVSLEEVDRVLEEEAAKAEGRKSRARDVRPHFLGAVVFEPGLQPTGDIEVELVIDGQQRLTTLQLLLKAFADICKAKGFAKLAAAVGKFTLNSNMLSDREEDEYKVWPTNVDQEHFVRTMKAGSIDGLQQGYAEAKSDLRHGVPSAYRYFWEQLQAWLGDDNGNAELRARGLYGALCQHLWLVVIDLDSKDDAQVIFESLNARGAPLLPSDLVKNYLFQRAKQENGKVEKLYHEYWRHFDEDERYWRQKWGKGHSARPLTEWFLAHYLTAVTTAEVPANHVFTTYRDFAEAHQEQTAGALLASLKRYSDIYRGFDERNPESRADLFFERLDRMGYDSAYPFLMELHARFGKHQDQVLGVLLDLESFLVRRMVCDLNTRGYNRLFVDMLGILGDAVNGLQERVRSFLLKGDSDSNRWPDEDEFKVSWLTLPLGKRLVKARMRMLLEGLEQAYRTGKSEPVEVPRKLQVEHIMPQAWQEHWDPPPESDDDEVDSVEQRRQRIQTIGNLSLLTAKLNPAVKHGSWRKKRAAFEKHSLLMLNKDICKHDDWDDAAIERRGRKLLDLAVKIWPYPAEG